MSRTFTWLDVAVLLAYLAGVTTLGMVLGRKQRNSTDYFVASHSIPWWALMFSIVATETSALTFISTPGLAYGATPTSGNLGFLQIVAGYIVACGVLSLLGVLPFHNDLSQLEIEVKAHSLSVAFWIACGFAVLTILFGGTRISKYWLWFCIVCGAMSHSNDGGNGLPSSCETMPFRFAK